MTKYDVPSRDVLICPWCKLRQFVGTTNLCRRCRKRLPITFLDISLSSIDPHSLSSLVGNIVRELRQGRGYSQSVLASMIGSHRTHVSRIENAQLMPNLALLVRTAVALGVDKISIRVRD
jgi:DNA-binding XRE family transcriptional regulator